MAIKPSFIGWIPDNTTGIVTVPGGKLAIGWLSAEKPPFQYMNWFFNIVSQWINFAGWSSYDVVVGSGASCSHATLAAAIADSAVGTNQRVLLTESASIAGVVSLTKAGWIIDALPGVTYTKSGGTACLSAEADGIEIRGLRFAGYTAGGDKAITGTAAWTYGRVTRCRFAVGTDTTIDDSSTVAGKKPYAEMNFAEV